MQNEPTHFPEYRPEIRIEAVEVEPFSLDFREMSWWFLVPEVGNEVRWASYDPLMSGEGPWRLSSYTDMKAHRPAVIHGREGVEIDVNDGLRSKAVSEAIYESAKSGQVVKVADVLSGKANANQRDVDRYWKL